MSRAPVEERTLTNSWMRRGAKLMVPLASWPDSPAAPEMRTRTGRLRDILMRSSTLLVMVAENNMVWRDMGQYLTSSSISSWKPRSNRRSASSSTSTSSSSRLTEGELRKWSSIRPGVQI